MGSHFFGTLRVRKSFAQKWLRWVYNWPQNRPEIHYNGVGVLRCQRHVPSKTRPKYLPRGSELPRHGLESGTDLTSERKNVQAEEAKETLDLKHQQLCKLQFIFSSGQRSESRTIVCSVIIYFFHLKWAGNRFCQATMLLFRTRILSGYYVSPLFIRVLAASGYTKFDWYVSTGLNVRGITSIEIFDQSREAVFNKSNII